MDGAVPEGVGVFLGHEGDLKGSVALVSIDARDAEICDQQVGKSVLVQVRHTEALAVSDIGGVCKLCDFLKLFSSEGAEECFGFVEWVRVECRATGLREIQIGPSIFVVVQSVDSAADAFDGEPGAVGFSAVVVIAVDSEGFGHIFHGDGA